MRFPSLLRRLRNTQGGMGSTAKSASTPYPYTPVPPPEPNPPAPPAAPQIPQPGPPTVEVGGETITPALRAHGPRRLSPLEIDAVRLVFGSSRSFTDTLIRDKIRIHLVWEIDGQPKWRASETDGLIRIAIRHHPFTDFLNHSSTRDNVDIFKAGNMAYLNTFIHECTHWWQADNDRYNNAIQGGTERYEFDSDTLRNLTFPDKESHASAAATWFVIGWQLTYRDSELDPLINLSQSPPPEAAVGTINRYSVIRDLNADPMLFSPGRWVTRQRAEELSSPFTALLTELRSH